MFLVPQRKTFLADVHRIVEYVTREQAQQAVNSLSNQNLMGRLVYVREVGAIAFPGSPTTSSRANCRLRIVKPSRALLDSLAAVAATRALVAGAALAAALLSPVQEDARSLSTMLVVSPSFRDMLSTTNS